MVDFIESNTFIFYNRIFCSDPNSLIFEWKFNSKDAYLSSNCSPVIPFPIDFNGIIVAQGVKVPYVGPQGGDPGYELDVKIMADTCERMVDFKFILTTIDTSRVIEHKENVIVLLDGIDSTYTVNFKHEIIPYRE